MSTLSTSFLTVFRFRVSRHPNFSAVCRIDTTARYLSETRRNFFNVFDEVGFADRPFLETVCKFFETPPSSFVYRSTFVPLSVRNRRSKKPYRKTFEHIILPIIRTKKAYFARWQFLRRKVLKQSQPFSESPKVD